MRVIFDDQIFSSQSEGGISRYFVELMRAFRSDTSLGIEISTPMIWTKNRYLIESGMGRPFLSPLGNRRPVIRAANRMVWPKMPADIVHHTFYSRPYLRRFGKGMLRAVTVYDMIPELFPDMFPRGNPHLAKQAFVDAADLIFCISQATQRDLVEIYGTARSQTAVVPLGVDGRFRPGVAKPRALPLKYVLYVGSRFGYKDFGVLARAFAEADIEEDVWLVVVGGGEFNDEELDYLKRIGIGQRALQTTLSDTELAGAYANALCFVFPSRYEGFGLPTLEAMATGCVTILASSSSHIEVGGAAALYFPPGDDGALADLLAKAISDSKLRRTYRDIGLKHAARFSWEETARLTAVAYHDALLG